MSKARNLANFIGIPAINSSANATAITIDSSENATFANSVTAAGLTLTSTDAGSSAGPELILYRNSASPADSDYIGQIQFKGRQDGPGDEIYAKVTGKISDASNGTEDGLIETAVKGNGSFTIVSRQKSDQLQLLNSVGLSVDGSVGIGTTSPATPLTVQSNTGAAAVALNGRSSDGIASLTFYASNGTTGQGYVQGRSDHMRMWAPTSNYLTLGTNDAERMRIDSSGRVGIGTSSPVSNALLTVGDIGSTSHGRVQIGSSSSTTGSVYFGDGTGAALYRGYVQYSHADDSLAFGAGGSERMRIDSLGSLLIAQTSGDSADTGHIFNNAGTAFHIRNGGVALVVDRKTSDGDLAFFRKDGTTIGKLTTRAAQFGIGKADTGIEFNDANDAVIPFSPALNNTRHNAISLGTSGVRFDDAFITNGVTTGSDERDKQDISALDEAETRVAVACKGLLRKWRWKDAVAEKDNNAGSDKTARFHFGIIAQDLKAAFEAQGLDAERYGMFMYDTWTDEETDEKRDRMGIRYSELLAFIIAAI